MEEADQERRKIGPALSSFPLLRLFAIKKDAKQKHFMQKVKSICLVVQIEQSSHKMFNK
jgi:hypothetical protein